MARVNADLLDLITLARRGPTPWAASAMLLLVSLLAPGTAAAQVSAGEPEPLRASAAEAGAPPVIDGRLDDDAWQAAPGIGAFTQHEPLEGRPSTERTEVRILYDRDAVYIGAR